MFGCFRVVLLESSHTAAQKAAECIPDVQCLARNGIPYPGMKEEGRITNRVTSIITLHLVRKSLPLDAAFSTES